MFRTEDRFPDSECFLSERFGLVVLSSVLVESGEVKEDSRFFRVVGVRILFADLQ